MLSACSKAELHLAGRPLLRHVVDTIKPLNPACICIVYGKNAQKLQQIVPEQGILWASQPAQQGTADAVRCALGQLPAKNTTLILYADTPLIQMDTLATMLEKSATDALVLLASHVAEPYGYGRVVRNNGTNHVLAVVEEDNATAEQKAIHEINHGVYCLPQELLSRWIQRISPNAVQKEYYLTEMIALAHADHCPIIAVTPCTTWETQGVNTKQQLAQLERQYQALQAQSLLAQGVQLLDPHRLDIRGQVLCEQDVVIDINCIFIGRVQLGQGVHVSAHCILKDCSIGANTHVAAFSNIDGAHVGEHCRIGPYARIRPHSTIGPHVRVGNFVEIKNTCIAQHSQTKHLSYLGDAEIGEYVNVGAGTITCNYDGVQKSKTVIADNAFIGSGTQLVAPVVVEKNAFVGAGTTLTKTAPQDALTLTRAPQHTIENWPRHKRSQKE